MQNASKRLQLYLGIFITVTLIGVFGIAYTEKLPLADALYFTIVTTATVGYGDISPQTPVGKALTLFLIVGGVGTFLGVIAGFTELLLSRRENKQRQQKLHMMASLFFSEMGTGLLKHLAGLDPDLAPKQNLLQQLEAAPKNESAVIRKQLGQLSYAVTFEKQALNAITQRLQTNAAFLLRLIENPLVLEEDRFADLLQAIFHLKDELINRPSLDNLPAPDKRHLEGDLARVYRLLVAEWLRSLRHLNEHYPYLHSLALRTNPFNPDAEVVINSF